MVLRVKVHISYERKRKKKKIMYMDVASHEINDINAALTYVIQIQ